MSVSGKVCLSDLVLVLGLGGAVAYLWRVAVPEARRGDTAASSSSSFLHWLFAEDRVAGAGLRGAAGARGVVRQGQDQVQLSSDSEFDSGLNILFSDDRGPEKFLKQRLFDLKRIRDTSRFRERSRDPSRSRVSRTVTDRRECGHRGSPDGEERLTTSEEEAADEIAEAKKEICQKMSLKPGPLPASSGMKTVMKNARDIRRLIREGSFDSLASDFSLDLDNLDLQIEFNSDLPDDEEDNDITITDDKEEYVLDKSLLNRFENSQMWRLTNSTRESSLVSDYSYDFKNERQLKLLGGYTSDDLASLVGSTADALEWDEDCFLDDNEGDKDEILVSHSAAWLPEYDQELDLESELLERRMMSPSPGVAVLETELKTRRDMKHLTRLPPSGASSVESLLDARK